MSNYRIAPHGYDEWKVQRRRFFLWFNVSRMVAPDAYEIVTFGTEAEAENWIAGMLASESMQFIRDEIAERRKRKIVPRVFP